MTSCVLRSVIRAAMMAPAEPAPTMTVSACRTLTRWSLLRRRGSRRIDREVTLFGVGGVALRLLRIRHRCLAPHHPGGRRVEPVEAPVAHVEVHVVGPGVGVDPYANARQRA